MSSVTPPVKVVIGGAKDTQDMLVDDEAEV